MVFAHIVTTTPQVSNIFDLTAVTNMKKLYSKAPLINYDDDKPEDSCTNVFAIDFVTPAMDVNITVKGHLRAGHMLFEENPQVVTMKHITPLPHEINYTCSGELSGSFEILRQERIVCLIESKYEFLKQDLYFGDDFQIFQTNNDIKFNQVNIAGVFIISLLTRHLCCIFQK